MADTNRKVILIADDAKINRDILAHALKRDYDIIEAVDGGDTLQKLVDNYKRIAVVLLDVNMPRLNGLQVMNILNQKNVLKYIPIILITSDNSVETQRKGYEFGAVEFITKPFDIAAVRNCIANIVKIYGEKNRLEVLNLKQNKMLMEQADHLRKVNENIMNMLGTIVEFRGAENNLHIKRVKAFTGILCESVRDYFPQYGLTDEMIHCIVSASALHDIGKIMIPDTILLKPSKLTADEYDIMKGHTTKGCEILASIAEYQSEMHYRYSYEICRYHHERYDGSGYPEGLKGGDIPLSAQIVSVAEAFDALLTNSVYRPPVPFEKAYQMVIEGNCGIFSPELLQCFKMNKDKLREVDEQYVEHENY